MVYISILVKNFKEDSIGKRGSDFDYFSYIIDKNNVSFLIDVFTILGICSSSHNKDVVKILGIIYNDLF